MKKITVCRKHNRSFIKGSGWADTVSTLPELEEVSKALRYVFIEALCDRCENEEVGVLLQK